MDIRQFKKPFYHTIIYDFYTNDEVKSIWEEIHFLHKPGKMTLADNDEGYRLTVGLDEIYSGYRQMSNILTINRKIFEIWEQLTDNPFAKYLPMINIDYTVINYYPNDSFIHKHQDIYILSMGTTIYRTPRAFEGGLFHFPEYKYFPDMQHNTAILFPSTEYHEVTPILISEEDQENGLSRYNINQFMSIIP